MKMVIIGKMLMLLIVFNHLAGTFCIPTRYVLSILQSIYILYRRSVAESFCDVALKF